MTMDDSRLDTSKTFTGDIYLEEDGKRRPIRIDDSGWLRIMDAQVLPVTLWFGCYQEDDGDIYIIKEFTNGGSKSDRVLSLNDDGRLGLYAGSSRPWRIRRQDGEVLVPRSTPEAAITVSTKGGRVWTANNSQCKAAKGAGSNFVVHIHKVGVYRF
ncbi:hypothetical protein NP537_11860 [Pseudomonas kurunegalensis]|nr:hypothetical protein [Pseudomonas kurunegalensis]